MRVQRDGDRQRGADHCAQAGKQFAFAVVEGVGHHRAMQSEQDAVEPVCLLSCSGDDGRGQALERIVAHPAGRLRNGA